MDIYCKRCGEPMEVFTFYHELTKAQQKRMQAGKGCDYCADKPQVEPNGRAAAASLVADIMPDDDVDGIASMLGDMEWLLGGSFDDLI
jgi:hypothetical protein